MVDTSKLPISRVDELIDKLSEINNSIVNINTNITNINSSLLQLDSRLLTLESRRYITETYSNGTNWYRIWSDGWIEQGGTTGLITSGDSYNSKTITFKKSFTNTNYTFTSCANKYSTENGLGIAYPPFIFTKNNTSIIIGKYSWTDGIDWYACGY